MRNVSQDTVDILTNSEILAINQDPVVGTSISPFRWGLNPDWTSDSLHPAQYWSGPTQDGVVFMLVRMSLLLRHVADCSPPAAERGGYCMFTMW